MGLSDLAQERGRERNATHSSRMLKAKAKTKRWRKKVDDVDATTMSMIEYVCAAEEQRNG